jgi:UPF0755 protein
MSVLLFGFILALLIVATTFGVRRWYAINLEPVSSSTQSQYITINDGDTLAHIATQLANAHLIRSDQAFTWYVSAKNARDKLQAGTYGFNPHETTQAIANAIIAGKVASDLITILPGQRLDQIRQAFIGSGFTATKVDTALGSDQYRSTHPALADNPAGTSLEGFLYPDSYQKTATTDPRAIIAQSLDAMQTHLTSDIRSGFAAHGLSVYQGVTLASVVEQEVPSQSDRDQAAQVFLKRLQAGMMLGSDVTAYYGSIKDGVTPSVAYNSPYNTRLHTGLPPGPISNVTASALNAVAHPANTDWLYFVAGDDGVTHFAKTIDDHNTNVAKYCHKLCSTAP